MWRVNDVNIQNRCGKKSLRIKHTAIAKKQFHPARSHVLPPHVSADFGLFVSFFSVSHNNIIYDENAYTSTVLFKKSNTFETKESSQLCIICSRIYTNIYEQQLAVQVNTWAVSVHLIGSIPIWNVLHDAPYITNDDIGYFCSWDEKKYMFDFYFSFW